MRPRQRFKVRLVFLVELSFRRIDQRESHRSAVRAQKKKKERGNGHLSANETHGLLSKSPKSGKTVVRRLS